MPARPESGGVSKRPTRSRGIEVPDLVGRPAAASVAELRKLGLKPNSVPEAVTDPSQAGTVIAQDPSAGELVAANTRVRVEIGDHSLFDARQYDAPPPPPPEFNALVPTTPEPLDLSDVTPPWVSEDELAVAAGDTAPVTDDPYAVDLESRWESLAGEYVVDLFEDPVLEEAYPAFDPETGEILEDEPTGERVYYDAFDPYEFGPRWTRKQRNRMLLAVGVLLLLAGLIAFSHLGGAAKTARVAHKPTGVHAHTPHKRVPARTGVVTVTVTAPTVTPKTRRDPRRQAPRQGLEHVPTSTRSTVAPASSPASAPAVSSSSPTRVEARSVTAGSRPAASHPSTVSSEGGDPADLSPTGVVSPPPNDLTN
jgi:hypothetical protein